MAIFGGRRRLASTTRARIVRLVGLAVAGAVAGCAAPATPVAPGAPLRVDVHPVVVTASDIASEPDLAARAERALMEQRWNDAIDAYRTLVAANATPEHTPDYLFNLGLALEGAQSRVEARDTFLDLARRFPDGARARSALVRAASLDAYLEDWPSLADIGHTLLVRGDLEEVDRIVALGSRGLARIELGDDAGASKDILDGLELSDQLHYGARDVLPVAVAQLRFALGELRRIRSERIAFDPIPPDFVAKLEERCGGLLEAQAAYAMAVRSIDPHWAAMSGYRVGEMYRKLHSDLMHIPPPPESRTEKQKQTFFAFMHVRYRILLEKGLRELDQTIALGERTSDSSPWIARAREAKADMDVALSDEKAQIAKLPFTEAEVNAALGELQKKTAPRAAP